MKREAAEITEKSLTDCDSQSIGAALRSVAPGVA